MAIDAFEDWRFTPTCVGTTTKSRQWISPLTVHPHVRGDNALSWGKNLIGGGSPPRAWGQRNRLPFYRLEYRFTPTCVGTTPPVPRCPVWGRFTPTCVGTTTTKQRNRQIDSVHPHVRGDNLSP